MSTGAHYDATGLVGIAQQAGVPGFPMAVARWCRAPATSTARMPRLTAAGRRLCYLHTANESDIAQVTLKQRGSSEGGLEAVSVSRARRRMPRRSLHMRIERAGLNPPAPFDLHEDLVIARLGKPIRKRHRGGTRGARMVVRWS